MCLCTRKNKSTLMMMLNEEIASTLSSKAAHGCIVSALLALALDLGLVIRHFVRFAVRLQAAQY